MSKNHHKPFFIKLYRTIAVGALTALIDFDAFNVIILILPLSQKTSPLIASPLAFAFAALINYLLSRFWVFDKSGKALKQEAYQFTIIALVGLIGENLIFAFLFKAASIQFNSSKIIAMGIMFITNFYLKQRLFTHQEHRDKVLRLRKIFVGLPLHSKLHLLIRWLTCPIPAITAQLPASGKALEIGCGRGLVTFWSALTHPNLKITGIDIDKRKLRDANFVAREWPNKQQVLSFCLASPNQGVKPGPWQAIILADVLYLMCKEDQLKILADCAKNLSSDGVLILKIMDTKPWWKFLWSRTQELISVKMLRITQGEKKLTFLEPEVIESRLQKLGLTTEIIKIDKWYPYPHLLILSYKQKTRV